MTPPPASYMWRRVARMQRIVPVSEMSTTRSHCSSVISTSSAVPPSPALFTRTSMRPWAASAASTIACTCASTLTSHTTLTGRVPPASSVSSSAASPSRRSCTSLSTTVAPSSRHRCAVAWPMPVPAAAVTSTTLPSSSPRPAGGVGVALMGADATGALSGRQNLSAGMG
jgi:hypothetical protein